MGRLFFGIDAGEDKIAICGIDESGAACEEVSCPSAPPVVIAHLVRLGATCESVTGIEAGGCGTQLTRKLRRAGFEVRVLDTRYVNGFLKLTQNKTDRNDARGIAEIVRLGGRTVPDVLVKAEAIQMLRSELVLRARLVSQRIAFESSLRGLIRLNGGKLARLFSGSQLDRVIKAEVRRLIDEGVDLTDLIDPVVPIMVGLRKTLETINRRLAHRAEDLEVCRRFMAIPGVGSICALSFYTAIQDPRRFVRSRDVGPYLGLVPKVSQSGSSYRAGHISRMGNTMTRTHLVTAAKVMMQQAQKDSDLKRWALRLIDRSGKGKARVALARKLATVMIAMWKSGEPFNAVSHDRGLVRD